MEGLDFLGAQPLHEFIGVTSRAASRAQSAGQKAIASAKKIQAFAPRLAKSVTAAGQKAMHLGVPSAIKHARPAAVSSLVSRVMHAAATPTAKTASARTLRPAPTNAMSRALTSRMTSPASVASSRTQTAASPLRATMPNRASSGAVAAHARIGDDDADAGDTAIDISDTTADVYSRLAEAAAEVADFVGQLQTYVRRLPPDLALSQQIQNLSSMFQSTWGSQIDSALSGTSSATDATTNELLAKLHSILSDPNDPAGVWQIMNAADAYIQTNGPYRSAEGVAAVVSAEAGAASTGSTVTISPPTVTAPPGTAIPFMIQFLNLKKQPSTPKSVTWSVSPSGATIDQNGSFLAQSEGTYTVTVDADGAPAEATVTVQAGAPVPAGGVPASTVPGSTVAKISVSPIAISVPQGVPQAFTASVTNAAGQPVVPVQPLQWTVTPAGATIDPSGNFTAVTAGTYTVTATADGLTGSGSAQVMSGDSGQGSGIGPGGGGGSGGGYGGDDGGGYPGDGGGDDGGASGLPGPDDGGDYGPSDDDGGYEYGPSDDGGQVPDDGGDLVDAGPVDDGSDQDSQSDDDGDDMSADDSGGAMELLLASSNLGGLDYFGADEWVGRGGGGHGGGGHGGGGRGFGRGRRGGVGPGWGWGGGPYWVDGGWEIDDTENLSPEEMAVLIAHHMKKQKGGKTIVGTYDIGTSQNQMDAIKTVSVGMARALLDGGQKAINRARELADKYNLPDSGKQWGKDRDSIYWKLKWHADELAKHSSDPSTTVYTAGNDLKQWVMLAYIDANSAEAGQETVEGETVGQMWADMWYVVSKEAAKLPGAIRGAIGTAIETITGIPAWAWWVGGAVLVGLVGFGVYRIILAAAPAVAGHAARKLLP